MSQVDQVDLKSRPPSVKHVSGVVVGFRCSNSAVISSHRLLGWKKGDEMSYPVI